MSKKRKAEKPAAVVVSTADGQDITGGFVRQSFTFRFGHDGRVVATSNGANGPSSGLTEAVARQIEALLPTDLDPAPAELPEPPKDLTSYADAFASARKRCKHEDAVNTLHGREWVCDACGRTLNRDDMRRAGSLPWWMS